jgi:hypothetical protein
VFFASRIVKAASSGDNLQIVAGVALRDILTCLTTHRSFFGGRHNTFAAFSENGLHFLWQTQHFGDLSDRGLGRF